MTASQFRLVIAAIASILLIVFLFERCVDYRSRQRAIEACVKAGEQLRELGTDVSDDAQCERDAQRGKI